MSPLSSNPPSLRGTKPRRLFGFTLIELLTVVVIIGILAGIGLVKYDSQKEKAYQATMLNDVRNFATVEETNAATSSSYLAPSALPGFRYSANVSTLGFSTAGQGWALLVTHSKSNTVCGVQSITGASIRAACGTPSSTGISASTTTPTAGETVVYDVSGFLAQVAIASPETQNLLQDPFTPATLNAASDYANATLIGWDFGDGQTQSGTPSAAATVTHQYAQAGKYTVKVGIVGASGRIYSSTLKETATGNGSGGSGFQSNGNRLPTAAFTVSSNPVIAGLVTSFNASGSTDTDGSIASYAWNFGDGGTGTTATATHTYATAGSYTVTLTVTDNQGGTNAVQQSVNVIVDGSYVPPASFTVTPPSGAIAGQTLNFTAQADPNITSYAWDFGDGNTATGTTASHTYATGSYTVRLTEIASNGNTGTSTASISLTAPVAPAVSMFPSDASPEVGQTVTFTATATANNSGATIASYAYDFGDFATASTATATHAYSAGGPYTTTLTVTDSYGTQATAASSLSVSVPATSFTMTGGVSDTSTVIGRSNTFVPNNTMRGSVATAGYSWAWGDGTTNTTAVASPAHAFSAAATNTVTLTVTDSYGATATATKNVHVTVNQAPTSTFTTNITGNAMTTGQPFVASATSIDPEHSSMQYQWVADGVAGSYTASSIDSIYSVTTGTHTIYLNTKDADGAVTQSSPTYSYTAQPPGSSPPAGMSLWFKGDDVVGTGSVSSWASNGGSGSASFTAVHSFSREAAASGNHFHVGIVQAASNEIMTMPLDSVTNINVGDEMTYVIVAKNPYYLLSTSTSPNSDGGFYYLAGGGGGGQVHTAGGFVSPNAGINLPAGSLGYYLLRVSKSAGNVKVAIGTAAQPPTGDTRTAVGVSTKILSTGSKPTTLNLGYYTATGGGGGSGTYYEIIIYPRALSDADVSTLTLYLHNKYGMQ